MKVKDIAWFECDGCGITAVLPDGDDFWRSSWERESSYGEWLYYCPECEKTHEPNRTTDEG